MQNAKDTFYEVVRERLTNANPQRTIVVRGVTRPSLLVEENELVSSVHPPDCFRLLWLDTAINPQGAMPLVTMKCAIEYETAGTSVNGGLDRGRSLAAMDGELQSVLNALPKNTPKQNFSGLANGATVAAMTTNIWWGEVSFSKAEMKSDRLARTAFVSVMSYQEAGEL